MNQRQLASVLFTAIAVFIVVSRLPDLFVFLGMLAQGSPAIGRPAEGPAADRVAFVGLGAFTLTLLLGGALILLRDRLATRWFPADGKAVEVREAQAIALSVLGIWLAAQGLTQISWLGRLGWLGAVQLVLGVALFFGAHGLSALWMRIRSAGRRRDVEERHIRDNA